MKDGNVSYNIKNKIEGKTINQYSLDEKNGHLRIALYDNDGARIAIFDENHLIGIGMETEEVVNKNSSVKVTGTTSVTALFWYITLPTGITAIVLGVKSARRTGSKMGKAGIITGIVGLSLFAFMYI